jgi:hypothetical protein
MSNQTLEKYPLLEAVLSAKGLPDRGIWKIGDVAQIFDVGVRSIHDWVNNKKLTARDLPGRGKFLSQDLEEFLTNSKRLPKGRNCLTFRLSGTDYLTALKLIIIREQ